MQPSDDKGAPAEESRSSAGEAFWDLAEKVVRGAGLASPRLIFKIRQARARAEARRESSINLSRGTSYTHKACPACGRLVDRGAGRCPYCEASVRWAPGPGVARSLGLSMPHGSVAMTLIGLNIVMFVVSALAGSRGAPAGGATSPLASFGGVNPVTLYNMGSLSPLAVFMGEVWRLWTYQFLHGGLLHIVFNVYALFSLGPTTEDVYGPSKTATLYWVTGVAAGLTTLLLRIWLTQRIALGPMTVGASGAIFGLIGLLIGHATRRGGAQSAYLRGFLVRWAIYGLLMGFAFGADNAAHVGGLVSGLVLGFIVPEGEPTHGAGAAIWKASALVVALLTVGGFIAAALAPHR